MISSVLFSSCFTNFAFPSHFSPAYSSVGTIKYHIHPDTSRDPTAVVPRCESVGIASTLPTCFSFTYFFPVDFAMRVSFFLLILLCVYPKSSSLISTMVYAKVYTNDRRVIFYPPLTVTDRLHLILLRFLQLYTAHCFAFAVTLHFLLLQGAIVSRTKYC